MVSDSLRWGFARIDVNFFANAGRDINLDIQRIYGYRTFCNKVQRRLNPVHLRLGVDNPIRLLLIDLERRQVLAHADWRFYLPAQRHIGFVWCVLCAVHTN
jgi:hypothetical protein